VDSLFFVGKLQATACQVGAALTIIRAADFNVEPLRSQPPALIIFDLNTRSGSAVELQRAARAAGCEQVLPRSKFTATLPELLREFGAAQAP
jgi:hypothetical protein